MGFRIYLEYFEKIPINEDGYQKIRSDLLEDIEEFNYHPEIFNKTLELIHRICMLPEKVKKSTWGFKKITYAGQPFNPIIRIDTGEKCAIGENIEIDGIEFLENALTPIGRCPINRTIPHTNIVERDGKRYIEEIGGCGRVFAREAMVGGHNSYPGNNRTEHSVALQNRRDPKYELPLFSQLLRTYLDYELLTQEQINQLK